MYNSPDLHNILKKSFFKFPNFLKNNCDFLFLFFLFLYFMIYGVIERYIQNMRKKILHDFLSVKPILKNVSSFFCPYNDSHWNPVLFWIPLTFIV